MMHPDTEVQPAGTMGLGVYATRFIPRGTIVYAIDPLDHMIGPTEFSSIPEVMRRSVDTYSYIDPDGVRILSWDSAKYVNHRCECNSLSTGWGFEIAVEDIDAGQEITDDYGMFNLDRPLALSCGCVACRQVVRPDDFDRCSQVWDARIQTAMTELPQVAQPLWELLDARICTEIGAYLAGTGIYRSVTELRRRIVA